MWPAIPLTFFKTKNWIEAKQHWLLYYIKVDYAHYILSIFPGTHYYPLPTDETNGKVFPMGLFLIPTVQNLSPSALQPWIEADKACRQINLSIKNKNPYEPWAEYSNKFLESKASFSGDPFLRTLLWEKVAFFSYLGSDYQKAAAAYEMAFRQGLEVGHLYQNYGLCLKLIGENKKAEEAFMRARKISSTFQ